MRRGGIKLNVPRIQPQHSLPVFCEEVEDLAGGFEIPRHPADYQDRKILAAAGPGMAAADNLVEDDLDSAVASAVGFDLGPGPVDL